jgi:hypothetical protein
MTRQSRLCIIISLTLASVTGAHKTPKSTDMPDAPPSVVLSSVATVSDGGGGGTCSRPNPPDDFHVDKDDVVLRAGRTAQSRNNATKIVSQIRCVKKGRVVTTSDCPELVVCTRYRKPDVAWDCTWSTNWVATVLRTVGTARLQYEIEHTNRAVNAKSFSIEITIDATINERIVAFLKRLLYEAGLPADNSVVLSKTQDITVAMLIITAWICLGVILYTSTLSESVRKKRHLFELALVGLVCTLHSNVHAVVLNSPQYVA